jgi:tight adherence protein C
MSALVASIFLFLIIAVFLSILGFKFWVQPKAALERVVGEVAMGQTQSHHPSLSFRDLFGRIGNLVPTNPTDLGIMQKRLITAGFRYPHSLKMLYGIKTSMGIAFVLLSTSVLFGFQLQSEMTIFQILAAGAVGWFGPNIILGRMASKRQTAIRKGLPNALDMLVICIESGLGLDQALMQVAKELRNAHREISDEFAVLNLEMRAGKRRAEALHHLGERTDVDELRKLVSVIVQADRFGTSISQTLRNFSDFMRVQMRQEAEEKAAKIGVKLVFPIFFFILPSLFVVTVGPMVVRVVRDFMPTLTGS